MCDDGAAINTESTEGDILSPNYEFGVYPNNQECQITFFSRERQVKVFWNIFF